MTTLIDLNNPYSPCETKKVLKIDFGVFDPDHIVSENSCSLPLHELTQKRLSVCEVTSAELYENGAPKSGGLNDPLMGTTDYRIPCRSCGMDCKSCPGHFGHLDLVKPVFNAGFLSELSPCHRN